MLPANRGDTCLDDWCPLKSCSHGVWAWVRVRCIPRNDPHFCRLSTDLFLCCRSWKRWPQTCASPSVSDKHRFKPASHVESVCCHKYNSCEWQLRFTLNQSCGWKLVKKNISIVKRTLWWKRFKGNKRIALLERNVFSSPIYVLPLQILMWFSLAFWPNCRKTKEHKHMLPKEEKWLMSWGWNKVNSQHLSSLEKNQAKGKYCNYPCFSWNYRHINICDSSFSG